MGSATLRPAAYLAAASNAAPQRQRWAGVPPVVPEHHGTAALPPAYFNSLRALASTQGSGVALGTATNTLGSPLRATQTQTLAQTQQQQGMGGSGIVDQATQQTWAQLHAVYTGSLHR